MVKTNSITRSDSGATRLILAVIVFLSAWTVAATVGMGWEWLQGAMHLMATAASRGAA
jgi:hypothetical protein